MYTPQYQHACVVCVHACKVVGAQFHPKTHLATITLKRLALVVASFSEGVAKFPNETLFLGEVCLVHNLGLMLLQVPLSECTHTIHVRLRMWE